MRWLSNLILTVSLANAGVAVFAADNRESGPFSMFDAKIGFFAHDVGGDNGASDSVDVNLEILFPRLDLFHTDNAFVDFLFSPHPMLGGTINTEGDTHTGYLGMTWVANLSDNVFFNINLSGVVHSGQLHTETRQCGPTETCSLPGNRVLVDNDEPSLGTRVMFREGFELGFRWDDHWSISGVAAHMSNAGLDDDNDGMNFFSVRIGYQY